MASKEKKFQIASNGKHQNRIPETLSKFHNKSPNKRPVNATIALDEAAGLPPPGLPTRFPINAAAVNSSHEVMWIPFISPDIPTNKSGFASVLGTFGEGDFSLRTYLFISFVFSWKDFFT